MAEVLQRQLEFLYRMSLENVNKSNGNSTYFLEAVCWRVRNMRFLKNMERVRSLANSLFEQLIVRLTGITVVIGWFSLHYHLPLSDRPISMHLLV